MQKEEKKILLSFSGGIAIVLGLVLLLLWQNYLRLVIQGGLPIALILVGVWLVLYAFGLQWQAIPRLLKTQVTTIASTRQTFACQHCGQPVTLGMLFCPSCGRPLPQPRVCSVCGYVNVSEALFCGQCGTRLVVETQPSG
jgi:RNA polymerase subunit RPABC4/transcription elongation factor Spt4